MKRRALWAAVATLVAGPAVAQSALDWSPQEELRVSRLPTVRVGTDATWPPMEYVNAEGEIVGFDIDLLREIGRRAGFRPVFESVAWEGIFAGLAAGRYEVIASSVTILPERRETMRFSQPYFEAAQYLVVRSDRRGVERLVDLAGGEIGAQIGTTGARIVAATPGVRVRTYDDLGLAVEDLANGRLEGIVADMAIVEFYVLGSERYADRLRIAGSPYAIEQYGFAIHPSRPELQRAIDAALEQVRRDGTLQRIRSFWFRHIHLD